ncbi:MAG: PQQ-dependent sugar dehydrogenase [Gammaproteobacteria bacterium]|nr:PQQ-dependent sugar dehydrogenase [Gammaproteobacteria bacterium]
MRTYLGEMIVRRMYWISLLFLAVVGCGGGGGGGAPVVVTPPPTDPFGLTVRPTISSLNLPDQSVSLGTFDLVARFPNLAFSGALFMAGVPGENRIVVVRQSGQAQAFTNDASVTTTTTVLDLSGRISATGEEGLLGWAFDPNFVTNRYIYVHYSMLSPRRSIIARFAWNAGTDQVDVASEKIILEVAQPFSNHNGGMLAFGPDDFLYIAFGDGGSGGDPQNNAQTPSNPLGSLLRIDVHPADPNDPYDVPLDNPFLGDPNVLPETFAYGLRNPFRFSFDRQTGDLWLGDVGQSSLEEIDIVTAGGNYGWRVFEGTQDFDGSLNSLPNPAFTAPILEYGRSLGVAVIGGYVYRGNALPSLQGRYLYTDFGSGTVWALEWDGANVVSNDAIANAASPTSLGEDNQGEVYIVSQNGGIFGLDVAGGSGGGNLPDLLSETGVFSDINPLTVSPGLIEYDINHPFWSDGAVKRRWIAIPEPSQIQFTNTTPWTFPVGTLLVKHFEMVLTEGDPGSARRLETRLLINTSNGWQGFTYRWNTGETDATLLTARETETLTINLAGGGTRDQLYEYPSRTDCLRCHTQAANFALGAKTRQLNRDFVYPNATDNQLRSWNNIGYFTTDIGDATQYDAFAALDDTSADVSQRARTYLDVNCAQCHRPGGPTPVEIDLRFDTADAGMNAIGVTPTAGDLGIVNGEIIAVGAKERSVLWQRLQLLDGNRMPPFGSNLVDAQAVDVVGQWIDSL